jgi:hypothetical protein
MSEKKYSIKLTDASPNSQPQLPVSNVNPLEAIPEMSATTNSTASAASAASAITNASASAAPKKKTVVVKKRISKKEAAAADEDDDGSGDCTVCCEPYNKSNHLCVECDFAECKYKACKECVRAYLLNTTNEPHCMECKKAWSPKFILVLNRNWLTDTYSDHRKKLLFDVEYSRMADTMALAEQYKGIQREEAELALVTAERLKIKVLLDAATNDMLIRHNRILALRRGQIIAANTPAEKKVFFMSCPAADCNGMLSTQYKCGICELFTCPDCHELVGLHKTDAHTCDPANVASAEAIKKETRQCPGCHNRIYRVEGCSQMWCTGCHTAFDWNTGRKVVSAQLHNPHWLDYQRKMNAGGAAPRAPGDVPCGGVCDWNQLNVRILRKLPANVKYNVNAINAIYSIVQDFTNNVVRETRANVQRMRDFEFQRIKYIVGEMSKEELATHIYRSDRLRHKNTEVLHVYELISAVGVDTFNRLIAIQSTLPAEFYAEVEYHLDQYKALILHANDLLEDISKTFHMSVKYVCTAPNSLGVFRWFILSGKEKPAEDSILPKKTKKNKEEAAAAGPAPAAAAAWTPTVPTH